MANQKKKKKKRKNGMKAPFVFSVSHRHTNISKDFEILDPITTNIVPSER